MCLFYFIWALVQVSLTLQTSSLSTSAVHFIRCGSNPTNRWELLNCTCFSCCQQEVKNILQISHKDTVGMDWTQNQLSKTIVFTLMRDNNCALKKVIQSPTKTSLGSLQDIPCIWLSAGEQWTNHVVITMPTFLNSCMLLNFQRNRTRRPDFRFLTPWN